MPVISDTIVERSRTERDKSMKMLKALAGSGRFPGVGGNSTGYNVRPRLRRAISPLTKLAIAKRFVLTVVFI
jgi:hypothetical protein